MEFPLTSDLRSRLAAGDSDALSEAIALLYRDLRRAASSEMRGERKDHTLQATGLVHEALIRMRGTAAFTVSDGHHFVNIAREVMRRVLKDHARSRNTLKRQHSRVDCGVDLLSIAAPITPSTLDWDSSMIRLEQNDPLRAKIIRLKYLLGCTWEEIATLAGVTISQARYLERESLLWFRKNFKPRKAVVQAAPLE